MENNYYKKIKLISKTDILQVESETENEKFIFYWLSNTNPFANNQSEIWNEYDHKNQIHLNHKYQLFCQNLQISCFPLLSPADNYTIDFQKMIQIHRFDNYKIRPIKIDTKKPKVSKILHSQYEDDSHFYWQANIDPWDNKQKPIWIKYEKEDQDVLIEAYKYFLENACKNTVELQNYFIDFTQMVQIHKQNSLKKRPIQICHPSFISNTEKINKYNNYVEKIQSTTNLFQHDNFTKHISKYILDESSIESKKVKKIYFNLFPEFQCELLINEQYNFFEDFEVINMSLQQIKSILIQEISNISKEVEFNNLTTSKYIKHIELIHDYNTFFTIIAYIYSIEGYLYQKLNDFLRIQNKFLQHLKYYYICLLASFQYLSKKSQLDKDKEQSVFIIKGCSDEEFQEIKNKSKGKINHIFKEFLKTTFDYISIENSLHKIYPYKIIIWEIKISKDILANESCNFIDIVEFSEFIYEKEILIRDGATITIEELIPFKKLIDNKLFEYDNIFKIICTLQEFTY